MKKRLRKKKHRGEFTVLLTPIRLTWPGQATVTDEQFGGVLDTVEGGGEPYGTSLGWSHSVANRMVLHIEHVPGVRILMLAQLLAVFYRDAVVEISETMNAWLEPKDGWPDEDWRAVMP